MVFLRPMVLRDGPDEPSQFTLDRYEQIRGRAEGQASRWPTHRDPDAELRDAPIRAADAARPRPLREASAALSARVSAEPPASGASGRLSRVAQHHMSRTPPPALRFARRRTPCCSRTTASTWCCGPARHARSRAVRGAAPVCRRRSSTSPSATLANRIAVAYAGGESSAATVVGEVESAVDLSRLMQDLPAVEDLLEAANDAPIIRMLNALLTQAAKDGASDIHIEPYERSSAVRFRVDGTLREVVQPNKALHAALISRLKIMAELDIAEKRLPQDGRISLRIGGRAIDVRVSTLPSRTANAPCCACWTRPNRSSRSRAWA
jgi:type II secretory ATPase GspE/PulE/Tfp pilus assembly ATPase PilB-like protein